MIVIMGNFIAIGQGKKTPNFKAIEKYRYGLWKTVFLMRFLELFLVLQTSAHSANFKKRKMDKMSGRRLHNGKTRLTDQIALI